MGEYPWVQHSDLTYYICDQGLGTWSTLELTDNVYRRVLKDSFASLPALAFSLLFCFQGAVALGTLRPLMASVGAASVPFWLPERVDTLSWAAQSVNLSSKFFRRRSLVSPCGATRNPR